MRGYSIVIVAAVLLGLAVIPFTSLGQPSEQEAYQAFVEAGCTACHNGDYAPDWNGTVQTIIEWAMNYDNIDEAVAAEYGSANSYDELMQQMRSYTPGITDEQFQTLYNFFLDLFNYYHSQQTTTTTTQTTTTTTQTETTTGTPAETTSTPTCNATATVTVTETVTKTKTKTVTETLTKYEENTVTKLQDICRPNPYESEKPPTAAYAPIVAAILVLAALVYVLLQAR
ncbi:MAG: hypothetical protein F7C34_05485 [Desulfurococcales archaeon]|nr:hypothetical protein [Desulfurococcales archaeon]